MLASAPDLYYSSYCLRGGSIEPETSLDEPFEPDPVRTGVGIGHSPLFLLVLIRIAALIMVI